MGKPKILFVDYLPGIDYIHSCGAGIGSSLFKLAALNDASEFNEIHLLTSPKKKDLLEGSGKIASLYCEFENLDFNSYSKVVNLGLSEDQVSDDLKLLKDYKPFTAENHKLYKKIAHLSFWRKYVGESLGYTAPESQSDVSLKISSDDTNNARSILQLKQNLIAIPIQSISKLKDYPLWPKVVNLLLQANTKINIVLLGDQPETFTEQKRVLNLTGKTDIKTLKAVISNVKILVGVDGLATNIAMALNIPTVILFTMISPRNVIDDLQSDIITHMVTPGCSYQFCYENLTNYRSSGCQYLEENKEFHLPMCLKFSAEEIVKKVLQRL